jgi:hypothetical protein
VGDIFWLRLPLGEVDTFYLERKQWGWTDGQDERSVENRMAAIC